MTRLLTVEPLLAAAFAPFGDVIEAAGAPNRIINQGKCGRHHDLARLGFEGGRVGLSVFDAEARVLPYVVDMVERHPLGSQAFIPLDGVPMLVVVAEDANGEPAEPRAFVSSPGQAINLHRNVWHGILAPLNAPGKYVVVDYVGEAPNLEEHWFDNPYVIETVT